MNRILSLYLDCIRFLAAVGVFLGHSRLLMAPSLPKAISVHASECVILFFVMSGLVIRFVTVSRKGSACDYLTSRAVRLYSVAIPSILMTMILDRIGLAHGPEIYAALEFFDGPARPSEIFLSLAFLNEIWATHAVMGSNEAYWSLGYEAAYYIGFLAMFIKFSVRRAVFLCLWAALFGPKIALYGLLWLLGAAVFDVVADPARLTRLPRPIAWVMVCTPLIYPAMKYHLFPPVGSPFREYGLAMDLVAFSYYGLLALAFSLHLIGVARLSLGHEVPLPAAAVRAVRWLAGSTFTFYLMHQPLILCLTAVLNTRVSGIAVQYGALALAVVILLILAEFGERRKAEVTRLAENLMLMTRRVG
jgi:peptidoglycan/LPS O-acetylase OafA/YrhL